MTRRAGAWLWVPLLIFFGALAPRLVFLAELKAASPTFEHPEGGDSILYDRVAQGDREPRAYFHSPLYQVFLSGVYRAAGRNLTAVRTLQHLLGASAAVLLYFIVRALFERRSVALVAAAGQASLGPPIFQEGQLLVDGLLPFLLCAVGFAVVRYRSAPNGWHAATIGAAIGLAGLARANVLVWVPVLAAWMIGRAVDRRRAAIHASVLVAALAAAVAPATVRNLRVERDLVLITSNAGLNFFIGNNPNAQGTYNLPEGMWFSPGDPYDDYVGLKLARGSLGHEPSSAELSTWWRNRALRYLAENPLRALELAGKKVVLLVNNYELPQLYNFDVYAELCPVLGWLPTAGMVLAPALAGLIFCLRRRSSPGALLWAALAVSYAASFLPFFVVDRYRAPWLTLMLPFAAFAVVRLFDTLRGREWGAAAAWAGGVSAALVACFWPLPVRANPSSQYAAFGDAEMAGGRDGEAERWYARAVAADPGDPAPRVSLGMALARQGELDRALIELERAAALLPSSGRIHNNLGLLHQKRAEPEEAERAFLRAIRLEPSLSEAYVNLGNVLADQNREEEAANYYRSALLLAPDGAGWVPRVEERLRALAPAK